MSGNTALRGRDFYQGLFDALVLGMGAAKGYLFDHGPKVAVQAQSIGENLGMDQHELAEVFFGAVLADVGDDWAGRRRVGNPGEGSVRDSARRGQTASSEKRGCRHLHPTSRGGGPTHPTSSMSGGTDPDIRRALWGKTFPSVLGS